MNINLGEKLEMESKNNSRQAVTTWGGRFNGPSRHQRAGAVVKERSKPLVQALFEKSDGAL
jgi:uncharacterized protein YeaC (DUF1315 family)